MQLVYLGFYAGPQLLVLRFQQQQSLDDLLDELNERLYVLNLIETASSQHASFSNDLGKLVLFRQLLNVVRLSGNRLQIQQQLQLLDALLRLLLVLLDADLALLVEEFLYLAAVRLERVHDLHRVLFKLADAFVLVDALLVFPRPEGREKIRLGLARRRDDFLKRFRQLELDEARLV